MYSKTFTGKKYRALVLVLSSALMISVAFLAACTGKANPATTTTVSTGTGGGGGAVINSDSIISGTIKAIHQQSTGYPWEIDVQIKTSQDVGSLPNPAKDKIGQVVTMKTDQDISKFVVGQNISARVKYVGDVPLPGITLYIYNIEVSSAY